jgi:hypothetical protein
MINKFFSKTMKQKAFTKIINKSINAFCFENLGFIKQVFENTENLLYKFSGCSI